MIDKWELVVKGQNVGNVNKDIDLLRVEVNDMPFCELNLHKVGIVVRLMWWGIIVAWVVKPN